METAVRTLPMRTQPIDGEALDSWLEATSHRLSSAWDDFTEAVGLPAAPLVADGALVVPVAGVYPLEHIQDAVQHLLRGGKILLKVAGR